MQCGVILVMGLFLARIKLLYTGPNVLIIALNRGKGIQFQVKLEFYEHIAI